MRSKIRCFTEAAIRITYRSSLRSSSMREPRDPLLKVLNVCVFVCLCNSVLHSLCLCLRPGRPRLKNKTAKKTPQCVCRKSREAQAGTAPAGTCPRRTRTVLRSASPLQSASPPAPNFKRRISLMILPQVHLRKPCYDF